MLRTCDGKNRLSVDSTGLNGNCGREFDTETQSPICPHRELVQPWTEPVDTANRFLVTNTPYVAPVALPLPVFDSIRTPAAAAVDVDPSPVDVAPEHPLQFVIWSNQQGLWVARGEQGYTPWIEEAGRFSPSDAERIVAQGNCNGLLTEDIYPRTAQSRLRGQLLTVVGEVALIAPESIAAIYKSLEYASGRRS